MTVDLKIFINNNITVLEFSKKEGSIFEYENFVKKVTKELNIIEEDTFESSTA